MSTIAAPATPFGGFCATVLTPESLQAHTFAGLAMHVKGWGVVAGAIGIAASACGSHVTVDPAGAGGAAGAGGMASAGSLVTSANQAGVTTGQGAGATTGQGTGAGTPTTSASGAGTGPSSGAGAGSGSGPVTSGATTGVGGGPPSNQCSDCAQTLAETACAPEYSACQNDFACSHLLECHSNCDWTASCNAMCDSIIPSGVPLLTALMNCVMCASCAPVCSDSTIYKTYCP